ncbi:hypothetical protein GE09DRAFT_1054857 [Coniochaeta sp. 2T2.1]|nr:hypothetical protein GE09DRAFT_1054857 [Coniochaeta sp. 2T2.1]
MSIFRHTSRVWTEDQVCFAVNQLQTRKLSQKVIARLCNERLRDAANKVEADRVKYIKAQYLAETFNNSAPTTTFKPRLMVTQRTAAQLQFPAALTCSIKRAMSQQTWLPPSSSLYSTVFPTQQDAFVVEGP